MAARDDFPWEDVEDGPNWQLMCDEIDQLRAQVAAVNAALDAALDQYQDAWKSNGKAATACVAAIAKVVSR